MESNDNIYGPLLPEGMANLVTSVSFATRVSLRCSSIFFDTLFEVAKYSTSLSLGISRNAITNALSTAKNLHHNKLTYKNNNELILPENNSHNDGLFYKVLDKYTNFGLYLVNHTFSLAELFTISGLQFTSRTIQSGLKAAEESVRIVDGIFGSNETSRAIASIISLIHRELVQDPDFGLAKAGKMAILAGLTKALTAFAVLQNVTHKRMMKQIPMTVLWEGVVTDDKDDEDYHKLIKFKKNPYSPIKNNNNNVMLELDHFLDKDKKKIMPIHNAYKITTKTTCVTTQTTVISPLDSSLKKQIIVRTNEEENQSYLALAHPKKPKFILSSLSEKTKKRKVERQEGLVTESYHRRRRFSSPDYDHVDSMLLEKKYSQSTSNLPAIQRHASISSCVITSTDNRVIKKKRSSSISSCSSHSDGSIQYTNLTMTSSTTTPTKDEPFDDQEDDYYIVQSIAHFMRYASAAYGESFMRILGIGDIPTDLPSSHHHHPNHHAFAHHTGNSVEDILLSSYTDRSLLHLHNPSIHALVHYVTVDHAAKAIVLTCRGTLGLSDILTDLSFDYSEFSLPTNEDKVFKAHTGMLDAAQLLAKEKGKVYQKIRQGLVSYPDYGLVMCGHSLGGGVASLLCVLWSERTNDMFVTSKQSGLPAGRPIHCYAYGPPGVMSLDLSLYCAGLVTSVVHGYDVVSSLSLGLLKDFKNIATSLHAESDVAEEIISRVVGRLQQKNKDLTEEDQWFWAMIKTMRADMTAEKMYPPNTVYTIETIPHTKQQHKVVLCRCEDVQARFSEIVFTRTMFMDHSPLMYERAIRKLCRGIAIQ